MRAFVSFAISLFVSWLILEVKYVVDSITFARSDPERLVQLYQKSIDTCEQLENVTYFKIQEARLKPATNSYLDPKFPKIDRQVSSVHLENATLLMLCRNWELPGVLKSMRSLEDRFNRDYHYPWVFLNDVDFTDEFIKETTAMATGKTYYATIPAKDWNTPGYINRTKYDESIKEFIAEDVIYGGSRSYRNMCHFNSGFFFRQKLLLNYRYYFRVEPGIEYFCDFQMDPFRLMREQHKKYGFVISMLEYPNTIPTLWQTVENFINKHPCYQHPNSAVDFITTKEPIGKATLIPETALAYNMCHFWSNFEIGDMEFFRSKRYMDYFNYLSRTGGFYYERWGDAPVHSIAAALMLDRDEIIHFEDIGYTHTPFYTFPSALALKVGKRCLVPELDKNIDLKPSSCLPRWWKYGSGKKFMREYFHESDYL